MMMIQANLEWEVTNTINNKSGLIKFIIFTELLNHYNSYDQISDHWW